MFHSQKTCTNSSRESEKIAKTRVCIARLCSVFSKLVTCLSISLGVKSVLFKVCVSALPKVCQSGGTEASRDFGHPSLSVSRFVLLSTHPWGCFRHAHVPGRSMKEAPLHPPPQPWFPQLSFEQVHPSENWTFAPKMLFLKTPKEGACLCWAPAAVSSGGSRAVVWVLPQFFLGDSLPQTLLPAPGTDEGREIISASSPRHPQTSSYYPPSSSTPKQKSSDSQFLQMDSS